MLAMLCLFYEVYISDQIKKVYINGYYVLYKSSSIVVVVVVIELRLPALSSQVWISLIQPTVLLVVLTTYR